MALRARLAPAHRKPAPDFGLAQVNIVLLLVLFFLVVGTIVETDELQVDLSQTQDLPLERLPRPLLLIDGTGAWALDGQPMPVAAVIAALNSQPEGVQTVHILAPRDLPADLLLVTLERLRQTPLGVTLVTLKSATGEP